MNGLTGEQIDKIKARLDALECIQGILSRVRTLGDKDWRLGCIYNHTAYPLNDDQAAAAWAFVERAPDDIAALLAHIDAQGEMIARLSNELAGTHEHLQDIIDGNQTGSNDPLENYERLQEDLTKLRELDMRVVQAARSLLLG